MMAAETLDRGVTVGDLLQGLVEPGPEQALTVSGIVSDSRKVRAGDLYLACRGLEHHGLEFAGDAVAAGAAIILWEPVNDLAVPSPPEDVPAIAVPGLGARLGIIADRFYGHPSRDMFVIGVTGTDGKTQTSHFIADMLNRGGARCGVLGTLGYGLFGELHAATHTTPDALTVHGELADMRDAGARFVAMEVSSHALDQRRVNGVTFSAALLTNLGRDHLDYHGNIAEYRDSKRRLFRDFGAHHAIINIDDPFGREIHAGLAGDVARILYGIGGSPAEQARHSGNTQWVSARSVHCVWPGLRMEIDSSWGSVNIEAGVLGDFNASNLLAALAAVVAAGVPFDEAAGRLCGVRSVPGRMEAIAAGPDMPRVIVDYAHTPQALKAVLGTLRDYSKGRLICVFGAGGDRDTGKRPLMGTIAERLADTVVLTDDNPRREDPAAIVAGILAGMDDPDGVTVIHDRADAIRHAISSAGAGDLVLIAGKGHETTQWTGDTRRPHDDRAIARSVLRGRVP